MFQINLCHYTSFFLSKIMPKIIQGKVYWRISSMPIDSSLASGQVLEQFYVLTVFSFWLVCGASNCPRSDRRFLESVARCRDLQGWLRDSAESEAYVSNSAASLAERSTPAEASSGQGRRLERERARTPEVRRETRGSVRSLGCLSVEVVASKLPG